MTETPNSDDNEATQIPRRGFVNRIAAVVVGAIVGLIPTVAGAIFFFDPLLRKREDGENSKKDAEGFLKLGVNTDALPDDGSPQLFTVYDDMYDAWNKFPNVEVGSVWLRRNKKGEVAALSSICPHLGCTVDYRQSDRDFYCPCHTSAFALDGEKKNEIPPRGMDTLQVKVKDGNAIWIKYEKFRATIPDKEVIS